MTCPLSGRTYFRGSRVVGRLVVWHALWGWPDKTGPLDQGRGLGCRLAGMRSCQCFGGMVRRSASLVEILEDMRPMTVRQVFYHDPITLRGIVETAINRHLPPERLAVLQAAEESEWRLITSFVRSASIGAMHE
jgi:hypothetical protein